MSLGVRVAFETLRSRAFGAPIDGTLRLVGTNFTHPLRLLKIVNTTNALITISYDGINDHDILPTNGFLLYDFTSNRSNASASLTMANRGGVWVSGTPTAGSVFVTALYAVGD